MDTPALESQHTFREDRVKPALIYRARFIACLAAAFVGPVLQAQSERASIETRFLTPAFDTIAVTVETQGRVIPFATAYRSIRRVQRSGRAVAELAYQWHGNDGSRTADTLWVDAKDLAPVENHRHNGVQDAVTVFNRSAAHTRFTATAKTGEQRADTTISGPLYASGELEDLIRLAPLSSQYSGRYMLYYGPPGRLVRLATFHVVRSATIAARNGKQVECWVVDAPLSEGLNTFFVAKSDRRVIRLVNHEDPTAAFVFTR